MLRTLVLACAVLLLTLPGVPDGSAADDGAEIAVDLVLPSAPRVVRLVASRLAPGSPLPLFAPPAGIARLP